MGVAHYRNAQLQPASLVLPSRVLCFSCDWPQHLRQDHRKSATMFAIPPPPRYPTNSNLIATTLETANTLTFREGSEYTFQAGEGRYICEMICNWPLLLHILQRLLS